jgi:hypothetical protein
MECHGLEVEVLEQLLSSAVQGKGLRVQGLIKQDPSPPQQHQQQQQQQQEQEADGEMIRAPTKQDYRDVHSRVVAARGEANTPYLTIQVETVMQHG